MHREGFSTLIVQFHFICGVNLCGFIVKNVGERHVLRREEKPDHGTPPKLKENPGAVSCGSTADFDVVKMYNMEVIGLDFAFT